MPHQAAFVATSARQIRQYARSRAWCEWEDFDQWPARIRADLAALEGGHEGAGEGVGDGGVGVWPPFLLLALPGIDADLQRTCAERWLCDKMAGALARGEAEGLFDHGDRAGAGAPPVVGPLRVGYLSGDFQQHATALLMVEMLEAHNAGRIELHAYSHGDDDGLGMRQRLVAAFHSFRDIRALSDAEASALIHADGIDILVDLKGYTAGSRTMLLASRPAPVQVSFLGYPGTLGRGFVDYLISDRFVTPLGAAGAYTEALACMPHSYQPHGRARSEPRHAPSRAEAGLPEVGFVFACFNQAWKFTPEVFDIWCRLLHEVPDSVLWLLDAPHAVGNLRREALARGVAPGRLVFAPDQAQAAHLARLPLIDLMLDTWPYNAHTTASDALWAGVPLVTCAGDTFASRVAGGLLGAVGLPDMVTGCPQDYADLARDLALDAPRLQAVRDRLAHNQAQAALFDVPAYTAALEALFERMWARHLSGQAPVAIDLA